MTENIFSISLYSPINCIKVGLTDHHELFRRDLFDTVINVGVDASIMVGKRI